MNAISTSDSLPRQQRINTTTPPNPLFLGPKRKPNSSTDPSPRHHVQSCDYAEKRQDFLDPLTGLIIRHLGSRSQARIHQKT